MIDPSAIRPRFAAVGRGLNERSRRLFAAVEARTAGDGGIAAAARVTGLCPGFALALPWLCPGFALGLPAVRSAVGSRTSTTRPRCPAWCAGPVIVGRRLSH